MQDLFEKLSSEVGGFWCKKMHPAPMWPIHNYYVCPRCQRHWPVLWMKKEDLPRQTTRESHAVTQLHPAQRPL